MSFFQKTKHFFVEKSDILKLFDVSSNAEYSFESDIFILDIYGKRKYSESDTIFVTAYKLLLSIKYITKFEIQTSKKYFQTDNVSSSRRSGN